MRAGSLRYSCHEHWATVLHPARIHYCWDLNLIDWRGLHPYNIRWVWCPWSSIDWGLSFRRGRGQAAEYVGKSGAMWTAWWKKSQALWSTIQLCGKMTCNSISVPRWMKIFLFPVYGLVVNDVPIASPLGFQQLYRISFPHCGPQTLLASLSQFWYLLKATYFPLETSDVPDLFSFFIVRMDLLQTRNVDRENPMKDFPDLVKSVALRIQAAGDVPALDQLTVNDYPPGVGLAPHIDTHSAFTGMRHNSSTTTIMDFCTTQYFTYSFCTIDWQESK